MELHDLAFALVGAAFVVVAELLAVRLRFPTAILLTIGGLLYALVPGPDLRLSPTVVFTFLIPPLLYSAALNSSLVAIRQHLRPIVSLSVLLVLATAVLIGLGLSVVVTGLPVAAGIALGAAVAPPDPVASLSIGRRARLPHRLITLIEGEGLLNDATALTTFSVAVVAAQSGGFSAWEAVGRFALAVVGGLVAGGAVAFAAHRANLLLHEPLLVSTLSLATPFAAYLLASELRGSGVLAVVTAGLIVGHESSVDLSGGSRLQSFTVWRLFDFLLQSLVFILIGQQLPVMLHGISAYPPFEIIAALLVCLAGAVVLRPVWLLGTQWLPRRLNLRLGAGAGDGAGDPRERRLSGREAMALSWAGTRGVITLATVLSLPLTVGGGGRFTDRSLLLFCGYVVVLFTLVGQGSTFGLVSRLLRIPAEPHPGELNDRARAAAARVALRHLGEIIDELELDLEAAERLRSNLLRRVEQGRHERFVRPRRRRRGLQAQWAEQAAHAQLIAIQRTELVRLRHYGRLSDDSLRVLEAELDYEEGALTARDISL